MTGRARVNHAANQRIWNALASRPKGDPIENHLPRLIDRYERERKQAARTYHMLGENIEEANRLLAHEQEAAR